MTNTDFAAPAEQPFAANTLLNGDRYSPEPGVDGAMERKAVTGHLALSAIMRGEAVPPPNEAPGMVGNNGTTRWNLPPLESDAPFLHRVAYPKRKSKKAGKKGSKKKGSSASSGSSAASSASSASSAGSASGSATDTVPHYMRHRDPHWAPYHDMNPGSPPEVSGSDQLGFNVQESANSPTLAKNGHPQPDMRPQPLPRLEALHQAAEANAAGGDLVNPGNAVFPAKLSDAVGDRKGGDAGDEPQEQIAQGPMEAPRRLNSNFPTGVYQNQKPREWPEARDKYSPN
jgi:hypothetical protein